MTIRVRRPVSPPPTPTPTPPPTPETWGPWTDTGNTRVKRYGAWSNTSTYRYSLAARQRKQTRTEYREKRQERTSHSGNRNETRWVDTTSTVGSRWISDPEPETWGSWRDTGRTRQHDIELTVEKEQSRTSNYGNTQTRWVAV